MLQAFAHIRRRRECAEQVPTAHVSGTPTPGLELANPKILQLVHDLKNQLTVVTLRAKDLQHGMPADAAARLSDLHYASEQAVLLIDALLADHHSLPSVRRGVDGNEVVRKTAQTFSNLTKDGIRLRLNLCPEPLGVLAAPGTLDRILLNLVLNALDAMPDGGGLTLTTEIAHAGRPDDAMPAGPYARFTISDTGCGMTAEVKARMFEAFFTTKQNGTGLGLRSVAAAVQQLHGHIAVDSEPDHGTSVTIMLPLAPDASVLNFPPRGDTPDARD